MIEYLKKNSLEDLKEEFGIKFKEYHEENLVVLNYNQRESPKFHPIVKECRGLIVDIKNFKPVCFSFGRFFNFNENPDEEFIFDEPFRVEEKVDGSLISIFYYNNSWRIASRGNAFAEGSTGNTTFHELFESIIKTDINTFMYTYNKELCYVFEICSMENKVVKLYKDACLYLLDIFGDDYGYLPDDVDYIAELMGVLRPTVYEIDSIQKIRETFDHFEPCDEGYVLIDSQSNRIKIKNPAYVDLHHFKGSGILTSKRICDIIFRGEMEEILSYFPEYREIFNPWQKSYELLIRSVENWKFILNVPGMTQKEFALSIAQLHFKGILFSMRNGSTLNESFDKLSGNAKVKLLEFWF